MYKMLLHKDFLRGENGSVGILGNAKSLALMAAYMANNGTF